MSKRLVFFLLLFALLLFFITLNEGKATENPNIKIDISFSKNRLKRGKTYKLFLNFKLKNNYLLNYYPILNISILESNGLDFSKDSFKANEIDIELKTIKEKKFIDTTTPITIPFEVFKVAKRGKYKLRIRLEGFLTNIKENYVIKFVNEAEIDYKIY